MVCYYREQQPLCCKATPATTNFSKVQRDPHTEGAAETQLAHEKTQHFALCKQAAILVLATHQMLTISATLYAYIHLFPL